MLLCYPHTKARDVTWLVLLIAAVPEQANTWAAEVGGGRFGGGGQQGWRWCGGCIASGREMVMEASSADGLLLLLLNA